MEVNQDSPDQQANQAEDDNNLPEDTQAPTGSIVIDAGELLADEEDVQTADSAKLSSILNIATEILKTKGNKQNQEEEEDEETTSFSRQAVQAESFLMAASGIDSTANERPDTDYSSAGDYSGNDVSTNEYPHSPSLVAESLGQLADSRDDSDSQPNLPPLPPNSAEVPRSAIDHMVESRLKELKASDFEVAAKYYSEQINDGGDMVFGGAFHEEHNVAQILPPLMNEVASTLTEMASTGWEDLPSGSEDDKYDSFVGNTDEPTIIGSTSASATASDTPEEGGGDTLGQELEAILTLSGEETGDPAVNTGQVELEPDESPGYETLGGKIGQDPQAPSNGSPSDTAILGASVALPDPIVEPTDSPGQSVYDQSETGRAEATTSQSTTFDVEVEEEFAAEAMADFLPFAQSPQGNPLDEDSEVSSLDHQPNFDVSVEEVFAIDAVGESVPADHPTTDEATEPQAAADQPPAQQMFIVDANGLLVPGASEPEYDDTPIDAELSLSDILYSIDEYDEDAQDLLLQIDDQTVNLSESQECPLPHGHKDDNAASHCANKEENFEETQAAAAAELGL